METKMKKKTKIQELEERIEILEKKSLLNIQLNPIFGYYITNSAPYHFHGNQPCWNNPCYWTGTSLTNLNK